MTPYTIEFSPQFFPVGEVLLQLCTAQLLRGIQENLWLMYIASMVHAWENNSANQISITWLMTLYCRSNESRQFNILSYYIAISCESDDNTWLHMCEFLIFWIHDAQPNHNFIFLPPIQLNLKSCLPLPLRRVSPFLAFCPTSRANARSAPIVCAPQA